MPFLSTLILFKSEVTKQNADQGLGQGHAEGYAWGGGIYTTSFAAAYIKLLRHGSRCEMAMLRP